jgi:anion-transporting  ArsA/GET3 family ATPase
MLDTKSTFDKVVVTYARTPEQAQRILNNRFYRNISGTLSGTQEYMAMEKLYELHSEGDYDIIVIDTPPTRNALDFLDAPKRMTDFFDSRVLRWFLIPYMKAGGGVLRMANAAAATFLRIVKRIVGAEVLEDTAEFFGNLEGMYEGFKQRAAEVAALLKSQATSFVVVTSPSEDSVNEAMFFATRLNEAGLPFGALVVNRVHPRIGDGIGVRPRQLARLEQAGDKGRLLAKLLDNEEAFMRVVGLEEQNLERLGRRIPRHRWVRVPYLEREAVDFEGLWAIADQLFGSAPRELQAVR